MAATDNDWFRFLQERDAEVGVDEVNFWYPKPWGGRFRVLSDGQPLLFKLKSPHNAIAGGGFFKHYTELPLSLAWDAFGEKNGAPTRVEVWRRITNLRREEPRPGEDPTIGCVLLVEPFFWPRDRWIEDPPGWHRNIQRGRTYDLRDGDGARIWGMVRDRLAQGSSSSKVADGEQLELPAGYGEATLRPQRLGQGTFRALITDLYERRCAVTGEKALPALDAAHIRRYAETEDHSLSNGLLLRSDVHRLFDAGYVTVTPEYRLEASNAMKDDFNDGKNYLALHGREVWTPHNPDARPDPTALRWHNERVFRG